MRRLQENEAHKKEVSCSLFIYLFLFYCYPKKIDSYLAPFAL